MSARRLTWYCLLNWNLSPAAIILDPLFFHCRQEGFRRLATSVEESYAEYPVPKNMGFRLGIPADMRETAACAKTVPIDIPQHGRRYCGRSLDLNFVNRVEGKPFLNLSRPYVILAVPGRASAMELKVGD
jgi:hypothetical protein